MATASGLHSPYIYQHVKSVYQWRHALDSITCRVLLKTGTGYNQSPLQSIPSRASCACSLLDDLGPNMSEVITDRLTTFLCCSQRRCLIFLFTWPLNLLIYNFSQLSSLSGVESYAATMFYFPNQSVVSVDVLVPELNINFLSPSSAHITCIPGRGSVSSTKGKYIENCCMEISTLPRKSVHTLVNISISVPHFWRNI